MALILGTGSASGALLASQKILDQLAPGLEGEEAERALLHALDAPSGALDPPLPGLGPAQRARLLAVFELVRRLSARRAASAESATQPQRGGLAGLALTRVSATARASGREWLGFVPLYRGGGVGALCVVEHGVRTHVNVDPVELFGRLLALRPAGFVLIHNHPSGDLRPSAADHELTELVSELGRRLNVPMLGHWIVSVTGERWLEGR